MLDCKTCPVVGRERTRPGASKHWAYSRVFLARPLLTLKDRCWIVVALIDAIRPLDQKGREQPG